MNSSRVVAIARTYFWSRFVKIEDLIDFSFWPLLDIVMWGGVGLLLQKNGSSPEQVMMSVLGASMVRVFTYCYVSSAVSFLSEMMSRNIINLFSTPLTFSEWFVGAMISGALTSVVLIFYATAVAWLIFNVNILHIGISLVIFVIPLLIFAWAVSNITIMILMALGVHAQRLIFVMAWLFTPFSGVYYSLSIMPTWIQTVAAFVPTSYVFEALRVFVIQKQLSLELLAYGYGLSIIYFVITLSACNLMFERSRRQGLASLERA